MYRRLFGLLASVAIASAACTGTTATPSPTAAATAPPGTAVPSTPPSTATPGATSAAPASPTPSTAPVTSSAPPPSASSASPSASIASPSASAAAGPDLTTSTYAPEPAATTGGNIVLGEWQFPDSLNPYYGSGFTDFEVISSAIGDSFNYLTNDLKYTPDLATNVPLVSNGGVTLTAAGMDVEYQLKPGMQWSDGSSITCADVIATWKWVMDPGQTGLSAGTSGFDQITGIDAKTPTDCVIHFKGIYEGYLSLFTAILPAQFISTVAIKDAPSKLYAIGADPTKAVYSGPYIPSQIKTDAQITLIPNPKWATISGHAPYLDQVIWKYYGDNSAEIAGYKAGEIDVANDLADADLPALNGIAQNEVKPFQSLTYGLIAFNNVSLQKKVGSDWQTVITAIRMTIDRNAIAAGPLQGTVTPINNFISPLAFYYKDEGTPPAADPAGASALLAQAGFVKGSDGILAKNGVRLEFLDCTTTAQYRIDTETLVASQLAAIGIKVDVKDVPAQPNFFGAYNSTPASTPCNVLHGNYDMAEHAYISPLDPLGGYAVYVSTQNPDIAPHDGSNETRLNNPAVDAAYNAVKGTVDFAAVTAAMGTLQDLYGSPKNTWELPLYARKNVFLVNPKVHNFVGNPSTASAEWNIGDWWLGQ